MLMARFFPNSDEDIIVQQLAKLFWMYLFQIHALLQNERLIAKFFVKLIPQYFAIEMYIFPLAIVLIVYPKIDDNVLGKVLMVVTVLV